MFNILKTKYAYKYLKNILTFLQSYIIKTYYLIRQI